MGGDRSKQHARLPRSPLFAVCPTTLDSCFRYNSLQIDMSLFRQQISSQISVRDRPLLPPSEKRYARLEKFLCDRAWDLADRETAALMAAIAELPAGAYLGEEHFCRFPCRDLQWLDFLWQHHSQEHFGFSTQLRLWQQAGGSADAASYETWLRFGRCVGWLDGCWLPLDRWPYRTDAPSGHLPVAWLEEIELGELAVSLWQRLQTCRCGS